LPIGGTSAANFLQQFLDLFGKLRIIFGDRIPDESNQLCLFCLGLLYFFWLINFAIIRLITLKSLLGLGLIGAIDLQGYFILNKILSVLRLKPALRCA
jgi:hypothetical protein